MDETLMRAVRLVAATGRSLWLEGDGIDYLLVPRPAGVEVWEYPQRPGSTTDGGPVENGDGDRAGVRFLS